ncbi:hypothetical protein AUR64_05600 [Haloprofundus marisrubri]|uniref:Orc1-like AAA ATPase domain-containing protein n=1 Tax=Haloprofundus marisrubri TaxID=1514971 RepID=A0A0W1RBA4_9EURY|nr:AAA family ATPase [Haloprofundus marisrubri]KTG10673.1 hypothetical protein AUR64_05600 [Haloprofundus marisrubri]
MDIKERIDRRRRSEPERGLVSDYEPLSPVFHVAEPTDRGQILEQLLDVLDPVFEGDLPPTTHIHGPKGSGKSAVLTALFAQLSELTRHSRSAILTTTRAEPVRLPAFVYIDAREAPTDFALYRSVVDELVEESVPKQGISTDALCDRLSELLDDGVVVAVDHVDEPGTLSVAAVQQLFEPFGDAVSLLTASQSEPTGETASPDRLVAFPQYERHQLVDLLARRTSLGLANDTMTHEQLRRVAEWADGDAHDALAAVFGAVDTARENGRERVADEDVEASMDEVPWQCVSLGRVLALPRNRQQVLVALLTLDDDQRRSVTAAATAIAASSTVDLSEATIKRFLYELAEVGIVQRVRNEDDDGIGRPSSRVEPRFPTRVFDRLHEIRARNDPER